MGRQQLSSKELRVIQILHRRFQLFNTGTISEEKYKVTLFYIKRLVLKHNSSSVCCQRLLLSLFCDFFRKKDHFNRFSAVLDEFFVFIVQDFTFNNIQFIVTGYLGLIETSNFILWGKCLYARGKKNLQFNLARFGIRTLFSLLYSGFCS